jgi:hypothetical protein
MRRKKKTTIVTFESRERMTIRHQALRSLRWCAECGNDVWMVTPNEAASILLTDTRAIFRLLEAGKIHFLETETGELLVCSTSLEGGPARPQGNSKESREGDNS